MMKIKAKKILSLVLSLVVAVACLPLTSLKANAVDWSLFRYKKSATAGWTTAPSNRDPFHEYDSNGYFWLDYTGTDKVEFEMSNWHPGLDINSGSVVIITSSNGGEVKLWGKSKNVFELYGGTIIIGPKISIESNTDHSAIAAEEGTSFVFNRGGNIYAQAGAASIWTDATLYVYNCDAVGNNISICTANYTCRSVTMYTSPGVASVTNASASLFDAYGCVDYFGYWFADNNYVGVTCTLSPGYSMNYWSGTLSSTTQETYFTITQNTILTAYATRNRYNINFYDNAGNNLSSQTVFYGDSALNPGDASNYSDAEKHYIFTGWEDYSFITESKDFYAQYSSDVHTFTAQTVSDAALMGSATCTAQATYFYSCSVCGAVERNASHTFREGELLSHTYTARTVNQSTLKSAATCESPAVYYKTCRVCGAVANTDENTFVYGNALGHKFTGNAVSNNNGTHNYECANGCGTTGGSTSCTYSSQITVAPSCTSTGTRRFSCTKCAYSYTQPEPANAHQLTYTAAAASTCTAAGNIEYWYCSTCSKYYTDAAASASSSIDGLVVPVDNTAHIWNNGTVTTPPTCIDKGVKTYTCTINSEHTYAEDIAPTGVHSYTSLVNTVAPTCVAQGYTIYKCETCNLTQNRDYTNVNPNAHDWEAKEILSAPTCTSEGEQRFVCALNPEHIKTEPVSVTAHSYTAFVTTVAPTCSSQGYTTYKCQTCNLTQNRDYTSIDANAHLWNEGTVTTEPTCTLKGEKTYVCTLDGSHTKTEEIAETGVHSYTVFVNAVAANCSAQGYTTYKCETCNLTQNRDYTPIDENAHLWNEGTVTTEPTCILKGEKAYVCTLDGSHTKTEEIAATGVHSYTVSVNTVAATCSAQGYTTYKCETCNLSQNGNYTPIDENAHLWNEGTVTTEPTCLLNGEKTYVCTLDGSHTKTEEIAATEAHSYTVFAETVAATCSSQGYTTYKCQTCSLTQNSNYTQIDANAHIWNGGEITLESTCTQTGTKTYTCTLNSAHTKTEPVEKANHTLNHFDAVNATSTLDGNIEYWQCSVCSKYFGDANSINEISQNDTVIAAIGHTMQYTAAAAATCTALGNTEYWYCTDCGKYFGDANGLTEIALSDTLIQMLPHVSGAEAQENIIPATCSADGSYKLVTRCTKCNTVITSILHSTPRTAHTSVNASAVAPTCTKAGSTAGTKCSVCNTVLSGCTAVAALGHNYVSEVTKAPTCTAEGTLTYTCTRDASHKYTEAIAKTAHNDADGNSFCDACNKDLSPAANCSCNCHKTGFMGFIWKLQRFFFKLFNIADKQVCACGEKHW